MQQSFEQEGPSEQRQTGSGVPRTGPDATRVAPNAERRAIDRTTTRSSVGAALKFVGRFAQMDIESVGVTIRTWHRLADQRWFQAEAAVAAEIEATMRYSEQEMLLEQIADMFQRATWFWRSEPGDAVGAAEPSSQYVSTLAMLALLVRDRLDPNHFEILYQPFAQFIPERELDPE